MNKQPRLVSISSIRQMIEASAVALREDFEADLTSQRQDSMKKFFEFFFCKIIDKKVNRKS